MRQLLARVSSFGLAAILVGLGGSFTSSTAVAAERSERERVALFERSLGPAILVEGQPETRWTLSERMAYWKVPGISVAVIRNGKLAWARGYGVLQEGKPEKVDASTVFSVGSVSKVVSAAISMRLVDAGRLDLDRDVNGYLKRWQVPGNEFTLVRPVTLRGILNHTAGLSVHGFSDFQPDERLPTVIDTLEGRAPASEPVRVIQEPGSKWKYSGGGITVEQLLIEEVTGQPFADAAKESLLKPLAMSRSTFVNPLPESYGNIAKAHDDTGRPTALPRGYESMPEMAASGLWTTSTDLARVVIALIESYRGEEQSFLSSSVARQMMTGSERGKFGLGPILDGEAMDLRFSHGGANDSYRAWIEGHLATGNGVVVLTNSAQGMSLVSEVRRAVAKEEGWSPVLSHTVRVPVFVPSVAELDEEAGVYKVMDSGIAGYRMGEVSLFRLVHQDGALYFINGTSTDGLPIATSRDVQPHRRLTPAGASRYVIHRGSEIASIEFVRNYRGQVGSLLFRDGPGGAVVEARKVGP